MTIPNEIKILKLTLEQLLDRCASVAPMQLRISKKDIEPILDLAVAIEKALQ